MFHSDLCVHAWVAEITTNGDRYLECSSTADMSIGLQAKTDIPPKTQLGFYPGKITRFNQNNRSHHVVTLSKGVDGFTYEMIIDADRSQRELWALCQRGLGPLANHSCIPNCNLDYKETESGPELFRLVSGPAVIPT